MLEPALVARHRARTTWAVGLAAALIGCGRASSPPTGSAQPTVPTLASATLATGGAMSSATSSSVSGSNAKGVTPAVVDAGSPATRRFTWGAVVAQQFMVRGRPTPLRVAFELKPDDYTGDYEVVEVDTRNCEEAGKKQLEERLAAKPPPTQQMGALARKWAGQGDLLSLLNAEEHGLCQLGFIRSLAKTSKTSPARPQGRAVTAKLTFSELGVLQVAVRIREGDRWLYSPSASIDVVPPGTPTGPFIQDMKNSVVHPKYGKIMANELFLYLERGRNYDDGKRLAASVGMKIVSYLGDNQYQLVFLHGGGVSKITRAFAVLEASRGVTSVEPDYLTGSLF